MLVYDKVEITEAMFNLITKDNKPHSSLKAADDTIVTSYNVSGSKVSKIEYLDISLTQYFLFSCHPV